MKFSRIFLIENKKVKIALKVLYIYQELLMLKDTQNKIIAFIDSNKDYPLIAAIASGLFPILYYYNSNLTLINSWDQFLFFILFFLVFPIIGFRIAYFTFSKIGILKAYKKYCLPVLNFTYSAFLIVIITFGFQEKIILFTAVFIAIILALVLYKHLNKIIVFQFLMAILTLVLLIIYMSSLTNPSDWMVHSDNIEQVVMKKKPNIYLIQPDGYANSSEIGKGYYQFDNSKFDNYLIQNNFKIYSDYRSNYYSTLSSNSSMFAMKHHYYNYPTGKIREVYNTRDVIAGDNSVIRILKNNSYKTFSILEKSYLLINRPKIFYDYCNIDFSEITYFSRGFQVSKNTKEDFKQAFSENKETHNFFFIEKIKPGHITNRKFPGKIASNEREKYLGKIKEANVWLKDILDFIINNDSNALIIIAADHGGFVGMNTTLESREKQTDRDLIQSIFTSQLAIKWPNDVSGLEQDIRTPVNLFRIIFSVLSDDESFLKNQQDDKSYIQINKGAPFGVYEYINEEGEIVFNRVLKE